MKCLFRTVLGSTLLIAACGGSDGGGGSPAGGNSGASGGASSAGTAGAAGLGAASGAAGAAVGGSGGVAGVGGEGAASGAAGAGAGGSAGVGGIGGAAGAGGSAGAAGVGGANSCPNPDPEPNDSEVLATPVCGSVPCEVSACDDGTFSGAMGPADEDWWRFHGNDDICFVNPTASTDDSGFRLCLFAACKNGTDFISCPSGSAAMSPNQIPGCCTDAPGMVEIDYDCSGSVTDDDSADITIRVDEASACTAYSVTYSF